MNPATTLVNRDGLTKKESESDPAAPPPIRVNLDGIHSAFRPHRQWVNWHWEWDARQSRWAKVPIRICRTGPVKFGWVKASSVDPKSWASFEEAAWLPLICERNNNPRVGIGFILTANDPFFSVDLDKCRDPLTGQCVVPTAQAVLDRYGTLIEESTSEFGLKLYGIGAKPGEECRTMIDETQEIEIYDRKRFLAMTGRAAGDLIDCQSTLSAHYFELFPDDTPTKRAERKRDAEAAAAHRAANPNLSMSDREIIDKMFAAKNGARARGLWNADQSAIDHYPSRSEADSALASMIAFYAGPDPQRIESLMLQSGLVREKWFAAREGSTYLRVTIAHVLRGARSYFGDGSFSRDREGDISTENYDALAAAMPAVFGPPNKAREIDESKLHKSLPDNRLQPGKIEPNVLGDLLKPPTLAEMKADVDAATAAKRCSRVAHSADRPEAINCHVHGFLYHPERGRYRTARFACGRWCCLRCAKCLKRIWTQHLQSRIETQRVAGQPASVRKPRASPVFIETIDVDAKIWARLRKRLHRGGAQYVRVRINSRQFLIVATRRFSDSCEETASIDASARVGAAINDLLIFGDTKKPIHTSKAWRLPRDEPSGWKYIGGLPAAAKTTEILDAIREIGGDPQTKRPPYPFFIWAADFTIPLRPGDAERFEDEGYAPLANEVHRRLSAILERVELSPEAERLLFG